MKTYIVYAHDSKFTISADRMNVGDSYIEFEKDIKEEYEILFVINSFGYAHAEDAEFTVEDQRAL